MQFILAIIISFTFAIDFQFDSGEDIVVEVNGQELTNPFMGGFNGPQIQWLDADDDGDSDLFAMDEDGRIRHFENVSTDGEYHFQLNSCAYANLQTGGWFFFDDFDNDNLTDLIIQDHIDLNHARFLKNSGDGYTDMGKLTSVSTDGFVVSDPVMTPTFADIDNDGDLDFFTGNVVGTVSFYENLGFVNNVPHFQLITTMWEEISIIGPSQQRHGASAINFIDLDGDNDLDLTWGDYFQQSLYVVWNIGNMDEPNMDNVNITSQFPINDPVFSVGQNMPSFTDIDGDNDPDLFVTVLSGAYGSQTVNNFIYYENIGTASSPFFEHRTHDFMHAIDLLTYTSPTIYDIDGDGDDDLFIGSKSDPSLPSWSGKVHFYKNIGTPTQPHFQLQTDNLFQGMVGHNVAPAFGDVNNDGLVDAIIGDSNGYLHRFNGIGILEFEYMGIAPNIDLTGNADPILMDYNSDGVLELFVSESNGFVNLYEIDGDTITLIEANYWANMGDIYTTLDHYDVDNDNVNEIILGSYQSGIAIYDYENGSWNALPITQPFVTLRSSPAMGDVNNDGRLDLFIGNPLGGLHYVQELGNISCTPGDMNTDGLFNILDIVQIVNVIFYEPLPDEFTQCAGDVNEDGLIDILDIVTLVNWIMG